MFLGTAGPTVLALTANHKDVIFLESNYVHCIRLVLILLCSNVTHPRRRTACINLTTQLQRLPEVFRGKTRSKYPEK